MTDTDIVTALRQRHANVTGNDARISTPMSGPSIFSQAADEIERLRKERDEARRRICEMEAECIVYPPCSPQQYAVRMEWDCFKEEKP